MKYLISLLLILLIVLLSNYGCKNSNPTEPQQKDSTGYIVHYKPNIYIYPNEKIQLKVKINFPAGGEVTRSTPQYKNGWDITVLKDGKINNEYDYLFYECKTPDLTQNEYGWIINKDSLKNFFSSNLSQSNYKENEINDFIQYWIPRLNDYKYYEIYPQYTSTMERMTVLNYSSKPAHVFRLNYVIKGLNNKNVKIKTPKIEKAIRKGYNSVEWGVILK